MLLDDLKDVMSVQEASTLHGPHLFSKCGFSTVQTLICKR